MSNEEIFNKLISGEIKEYEVKPEDAFDFQKDLRNFGKRQKIKGIAQRGGSIMYTSVNSDD